MPIISQIGRKSPKTRLLIGSIYATLLLGAATMIYPFLLMIAGSSKSAVDMPEMKIVPSFLRDSRALYRKHIEGLFSESLDMQHAAYDSDVPSFQTLEPPPAPNRAFAESWRRFLEQAGLPAYCHGAGYIGAPASRGTIPHGLRLFKAELAKRFGGDLARLNREMETKFMNWRMFRLLPENYLMRRSMPGGTRFDAAFRDFKERQPLESRFYFSPEGFFKRVYLKAQYSGDLAAYNNAHGTAYGSWEAIHLDRRLPEGPGRTDQERQDWETFVRTILNLLWIRADDESAPLYRRFLRAKYRDLEGLNRNYMTSYASFEEAPLIEEPPMSGLRLSDWEAFVQGWTDPDTGETHQLPASMIRIHSVDFLFRDFLRAEYGSIDSVNRALGASFGDWIDIFPPQRDWHYFAFLEQAGWLKREFLLRNFASVLDYMAMHGRGILNTAIYCALAVLAALLVNPLAAYALSRYKPPSTYKVLLFLMLTMAFPPMVTQIPVFLMLRDLNLLNTFWALILPGLASGYSIFLLKGFFDSLPRELYESAALDGAGEFRIFWQITMSLSKPILAVIALQAFTHAYSNFMMALLICQDEKMWTLMPWLYQLQQRSDQGVIYASLLVAAVPTFIVFALCQNVIMRGIVAPVEK